MREPAEKRTRIGINNVLRGLLVFAIQGLVVAALALVAWLLATLVLAIV